MPNASQGAYGLATNAGTAANANSLSTGNALLSGMGAGATTTLNGRQIAQNGLSSILSNQTSSYNAAAAAEGQGTGALIGAGATIAVAI